jgi:hypothetical protein
MGPLSLRALAVAVLLIVAACGSSANTSTSDAATDRGARGTGGSVGVGGSIGVGSTGGSGVGGATGTGGSDAGMSTTDSGTQPLGAVCANTGNCSQADGTAVCCLSIATCVLDTQCQGGSYVSCETQPCTKSGWVCCNAGGMHFCTKPSACP